MSEDAGLESLNARLRVVEERLKAVHSFEVRRWCREERSAERDYLTRGLIRVHASDEDLRSAGVDPTVLKTVFDTRGESQRELEPLWESEGLWEIKGEGIGLSYGYCWGCTIEASVHTEHYLSPRLAAKVNALRAQKYLRGGGSVEEAEQCEGGYAFDRKFVEAVRAQARRATPDERNAADGPLDEALDEPPDHSTPRDEPTATLAQLEFFATALAYQGIIVQTYLVRMLGGISTFLIVTALGTAVDELRTGLLLGVAAWAVAWILARLWHKRFLKAAEGEVDEAAAAAGFGSDFTQKADQYAIGRVFGGRGGRPVNRRG